MSGSTVKDDQDALIGASLETLVRHVSETSRQELAALRAAFDQHISSVEARLEASHDDPAIHATIKNIARVSRERIDHVRQQAETTVTQTLAANTVLRTALADAKQQLESAQTTVATAEGDRQANAARHQETLNEKNKLAAALDTSHAQLLDVQARLNRSQQETDALVAERVALEQRLKDVTAARATAEAQYRRLVAASQKLTDALSQTLRQEREAVGPNAEAAPMRDELADNRVANPIAPLNTTSSKSTPSTNPSQTSAVRPQKNLLRFSEKARDAKRVKVRLGIHVDVDGIPGELIDLSIGGAQAVLRQSVKPNQLVRLVLPAAAGQLICKGRIVWVIYERPGTSLSVYRTGLTFTNIDAAAVEDFMNDFSEEPPARMGHSSGVA
jgi:hypothetical protein